MRGCGTTLTAIPHPPSAPLPHPMFRHMFCAPFADSSPVLDLSCSLCFPLKRGRAVVAQGGSRASGDHPSHRDTRLFELHQPRPLRGDLSEGLGGTPALPAAIPPRQRPLSAATALGLGVSWPLTAYSSSRVPCSRALRGGPAGGCPACALSGMMAPVPVLLASMSSKWDFPAMGSTAGFHHGPGRNLRVARCRRGGVAAAAGRRGACCSARGCRRGSSRCATYLTSTGNTVEPARGAWEAPEGCSLHARRGGAGRSCGRAAGLPLCKRHAAGAPAGAPHTSGTREVLHTSAR